MFSGKDQMEEGRYYNLGKDGVTQWEIVTQDRQKWKAIVKAGKTHEKL